MSLVFHSISGSCGMRLSPLLILLFLSSLFVFVLFFVFFCLIAWGLGRTSTIPFFFFFSSRIVFFGRIAFQVIVKFVSLLWSVVQVLAHARRILLSTICLYHHHLIPLRVLVRFVLCFFFLLLRPRASALTTTSLLEVVLSVNGWSRARRAVSPIFNRDSPLHLILRLLSFLISAFSREPGNGNLLFILRFCNYQLPSYTSIRRRLSLSLSLICLCPFHLFSYIHRLFVSATA